MNIKLSWLAFSTGALFLFSGCGQLEGDVAPASETQDSGEADRYYGDLALPSVRPAGLAFVRIEKFADPAIDGQRVQLVFGSELGGDTVYLCTRPAGGAATAGTASPYPGKRILRVVGSGSSVETVYALDVQDPQTESKGGSAAARRAIGDVLAEAATEEGPLWFATMLDQEAE